MLAVDLLELLRRVLGIFLGIEEVQTLIVELVRRLIGKDGILVEHAAGAEQSRERRKQEKARQCPPAALKDSSC